MGFLDNYAGTERIDLEDGYWIDIKICLSRDEKRAAEGFMSRVGAVSDPNDDKKMITRAVPDLPRYRDELVIASIVDWNLDDTNGTVWRLDPPSAKRANVGRLPDAVFDKVYKRADALNKEPEVPEQKTFRNEPGERDPEGLARTGDVVDVFDREGVLAGTGLDQGDGGLSALA